MWPDSIPTAFEQRLKADGLYRQVFLYEREQLRQMLKQDILSDLRSRSSVVNVTSLCQTAPMNGFAPYSACKGGVFGLSKCDARDYGKIQINCLTPGNTVTPMLCEAVGNEGLKMLALPHRWGGQRNVRGHCRCNYLAVEPSCVFRHRHDVDC